LAFLAEGAGERVRKFFLSFLDNIIRNNNKDAGFDLQNLKFNVQCDGDIFHAGCPNMENFNRMNRMDPDFSAGQNAYTLIIILLFQPVFRQV